MDSVSSLSPLLSASAGASSLLRAGTENIAVTATLLKQATNADKQMLQELLPEPPHNGRLNIRA